MALWKMNLLATMVVVLAAPGLVVMVSGAGIVEVDWSRVVAVSNTTTTLQVVANPILNPATSPVAHRAGESLAALNADLVRYVPWFPYPKVGVAELEPPNAATNTTSWNFEWILPQLELVMNATLRKGHTVVPNFSTQPTWMYDTPKWDYPADPNTADFGYPRGNARANTTRLVAEYYGRLLSWLTNGEFVDEYGTRHTGGPKYNLTHWEVFNEPQGCHGLNAQQYNKQYDAVVKEIRRQADPNHRLKFVGLAASGQPLDWIASFLNHSNHAPDTPLDYVSFHFYASCTNRTDPDTYTSFFGDADQFLQQLEKIAHLRSQLSPNTKLSCDETGVILPHDNDPTSPVPPRIYWNAAAAMYAYLVPETTKLGLDVLGESQLAGSPPIPEWDIPDPQYPSVSMLNWTSGEGNARYWVLKLMIEELAPGDKLVHTTMSTTPHSPLCAKVDGHVGYGNVSLMCHEDDAVITNITFASFGTPTGTCGHYKTGACDASNTTAIVTAMCKGKRACTVASYPTFGDPCYGVYKDLVVQAACTRDSGGFARPPDYPGDADLYAQAYVTKGGHKKVLVVNKSNVHGSARVMGATHMRVVDLQSGDGPPRSETVTNNVVFLSPFAVAIVAVTQ
ncbi:hypothetical protein PTSG_07279 [Salpingoeca rosetta]|uniref:SUEL-type lectin domain-containing protein n=1 Tax=Salpingoeca rosetta (strain ATCC 50818 / BSB-021) TaxID=946362 RepID=F2UIZ0_SALR5|nr:uncharacterized protein PTSG_07279 [Salpingoeca rosetta]EGD76938.1 hypothetical protein PTSG_07279 [Salpingoeca rosetta]|eukprot:XP_004990778.1 hypothetical protein PTSG_07279 [Salpingoeca rosetta]